MNKQQRKELQEAIDRLEECQAVIESMAEDERIKLDNMPEGLLNSERGQAIEEAASALEDAASAIGDAVSSLQDYV